MSSMFTRNDKGPEIGHSKVPGSGPEASAAPMTPAAPPAAEPPKRPQASAQPLGGGAPAPVGVSVISRALKITGQLESSEDIQIEGEVEGDVHAVRVRVGSGAKIRGTVFGEEVELAGTVDGKIEARKVVLTSTAHMSGDIVHQDIAIQSGAYMNGHCKPEFGKNDTKNVQPFQKPAAHGAD
jgi:cytoskeletal protein CcmA (bactofilin family)